MNSRNDSLSNQYLFFNMYAKMLFVSFLDLSVQQDSIFHNYFSTFYFSMSSKIIIKFKILNNSHTKRSSKKNF